MVLVRDFINKSLGGPTKVAAALNEIGVDITARNVQMWNTREEIPPKWRPKVAYLALRANVKEKDMPAIIRETVRDMRSMLKVA